MTRPLPAGMVRGIPAVADAAGLRPDEVEPYGDAFGKVDLAVLDRLPARPRGKYVVVTAVTPTPRGEGKTTQTVGLAMALCALGARAIATLRQPSLGPVFGRKGGGAGGGRSRLVPGGAIGLHATGDLHAVAAAHNLLAARLDSTLVHGNPLSLDPEGISWTRVVDMSDRALRRVAIGLGETAPGARRETSFEITAASEVMACLALAGGAADLRERLARIVAARDLAGAPVTARALGASGAMAALLRDAVRPTLVSTCEGTPCLMHAGPFANVAHGNSSVLADRIGLGLADYVVTESGFGAEMGAEKLFNIKCRAGGLVPAAAVLVATVRALRRHGGARRGPEVADEALRRGLGNLSRQIGNVRAHGVPVVVAINAHPGDADGAHEAIAAAAREAGAFGAETSRVYAEGSAGGVRLAREVVRACEEGGASFRFLYPDDQDPEGKIGTIATRMYGAARAELAPAARASLARFDRWGFSRLPVCMAKTQFSLSHDRSLGATPSGFVLPVRDVRLAAGAGFLVALCGDVQTMPGLPSEPNLLRIDLDAAGNVAGLD